MKGTLGLMREGDMNSYPQVRIFGRIRVSVRVRVRIDRIWETKGTYVISFVLFYELYGNIQM